MEKVTRGVRNSNPGNLDKSPANKWQGLADEQPDSRFATFKSPEYGIRALARTLISYQDKHNLRTVRGIINRWAPPVENDTGAYVRRVARDMGVGPDDAIDVHDAAYLKPLTVAIIAHENAGYAYPDAVVDKALVLAGVEPPPKPKPQLMATPTPAAAITGGIAGAGGIATVVQQVVTNEDLKQAVASSGVWWLPLVLSVLAAGALGFIAFNAWRKHRRAAS